MSGALISAFASQLTLFDVLVDSADNEIPSRSGQKWALASSLSAKRRWLLPRARQFGAT